MNRIVAPGKENIFMHHRIWLIALGLVVSVPSLATAEITGGVMTIRGAEMS